MRRVNVVFGAIVVGAVLTGGAATVSFGTELRTVDTISAVERQLDSSVTALRVVDGELHVSVRLVNPTEYPIRLHGTFVRVFPDGGGTQLAYGAGDRVDGGPVRLDAHSDLRAAYVVRLTPEQADRVREAVSAGPVRVRLFHSLSLGDESFRLVRTDDGVVGEDDG